MMNTNIISKHFKIDNNKNFSQCYLINSQNDILILENLLDWAKSIGINEPDQHILTDSARLKIIDLRQLFKIISYKNYSSKFKLVIIKGVDEISLECANALLKTLEEPPNGTIIVLTSKSLKKILPTIVSRCQVIRLNTQTIISNAKKEEIINQIQLIKDMSCRERFQFVDNYIKDDDPMELLNNWLIIYKERILSYDDRQIIKKITNAQKILSTTNASRKLILENVIIDL